MLRFGNAWGEITPNGDIDKRPAIPYDSHTEGGSAVIIRKIRQEELKRCAQLSALAFEYPMEGAEQPPEEYARRLIESPGSADDLHWDSRWAAFEDDDRTMMATFCVIPWRANFDGHAVTMGGIGGVASLPQYRRGGAIRRCFEAALPDMYERGMVLSYLYPFSNAFYRKFGYEIACDEARWRVKLSLLPSLDAPGRWAMQEKGADLTADIRAIDEVRARRYNCAIFGGDTEYLWTEKDPFVTREYVYVYYDAAGRPSAYAAIRARPGQELECARCCFNDRAGLEGLLALLRRYAADHSHAVIPMPVDVDPRAIFPEFSFGTVERSLVQRGMVRVVNVERALALARTKGEGTLVVRVADGQIPRNDGTFEVRFAPGAENEVRRTDAAPDVELSIQDFSRLLVGCCELYPEWLPGARVHCEMEKARRVFYRKGNYISQRF